MCESGGSVYISGLAFLPNAKQFHRLGTETKMKRSFLLIWAFATLALGSDDLEEDKYQEKRSLDDHGGYGGGGGGGNFLDPGFPAVLPGPQLLAQHVEVERLVPVVHFQGVPVGVPHPVAVPVHIPVHVPEPVPVHVPLPVPVLKTVAVPVEKPVPYPVEKPYPVHIFKKVPVPVPKPYPVPVPVYKTKHVYHQIVHAKHHGW